MKGADVSEKTGADDLSTPDTREADTQKPFLNTKRTSHYGSTLELVS